MSEAQAAARLQQRALELSAASIRALAGERDLHFRGRRLHRQGRALPHYAPHLHPDPEHDDAASFRGAADGLALRLLHSDAALHASLAPAGAVERFVFSLLEQYRVEALGGAALAGVRHNLRHRHDAWSLAFHVAGRTETAAGLLIFTAAQVCRARVTADPIGADLEDLIEATRAGISPLIGHALAGLRRERGDQPAYAVHALNIAAVLAGLLHGAGPVPGEREARLDDDLDLRNLFGLVLENDSETSERYATVVSPRRGEADDGIDGYRVFTTAYDREDTATALARPAELAALREQLDRRIAGQAIHRARLVRDLRSLLARPAIDGWDGGLEEGLIDGRRLATLVASPSERRLFRAERVQPVMSAAVSFLIDCSGSMKAHAETLAVLVDTVARALDEAGAACEILGFSTAAWNGGRARRDWQRAGRPVAPGRLNERAHIVFKGGDSTWRQGRAGIAALLKSDLFKEGIDGEAVGWACGRLRARDEDTKVLLVVSDGSPMDAATRLANDAAYLDRHLRAVVSRRERAGGIAVHGLGVGLDLSGFYASSHVLDLGAGIGNAMFGEILAMLARKRQR